MIDIDLTSLDGHVTLSIQDDDDHNVSLIQKKKIKIKIKRAFYLTTGGKVDIYIYIYI
jgi:hypothetical protein